MQQPHSQLQWAFMLAHSPLSVSYYVTVIWRKNAQWALCHNHILTHISAAHSLTLIMQAKRCKGTLLYTTICTYIHIISTTSYIYIHISFHSSPCQLHLFVPFPLFLFFGLCSFFFLVLYSFHITGVCS